MFLLASIMRLIALRVRRMFDFSLKPGENQWQYKWRIYQAKQSGLIDMDWEDLGAKIDATLRPDEPQFNESVYRKESALLHRYWENVFFHEKVPNMQAEMDKLYQARRLLADQRREYNKLLVSDARAEHLGEEMLLAVERMNKDYPLLSSVIDGRAGFTSKEAVLFISDVHYGMITDNMWNKYDVHICKKRLEKLTEKATNVCLFQGVRRLHVVLLGDMCHGAIKTSCRVASEEGTIDQLMHVSELLAQVIDKLASVVPEVDVYSTYGNHARVVANKKESIHSDNMERILPWWLRERLAMSPRIHVHESPYHEFIKIDVFNVGLVAPHGDLDNIRDAGLILPALFANTEGAPVKYVVMGDKHHQESYERLGVESYIVGSLCGTDDYANEKRLFSKPSQMMMVFGPEEGLECTYNISVE